MNLVDGIVDPKKILIGVWISRRESLSDVGPLLSQRGLDQLTVRAPAVELADDSVGPSSILQSVFEKQPQKKTGTGDNM